jgi:hypothetical protein
MTREELWLQHYKAFMGFLERNKRRPSKYVGEEREMLNWLKYNKKLAVRGKLPENRKTLLDNLLEQSAKLRRLNQYVYANPLAETTVELSLF